MNEMRGGRYECMVLLIPPSPPSPPRGMDERDLSGVLKASALLPRVIIYAPA